MFRIPDPKVRLLFSAPLSAVAAALARTPEGQEPGMASAVPRVLVAAFVCAAIAYVASSADGGRRGPWNLVGGLAMAAGAATSLSFGASLCAAMAFAGGLDVLTGVAAAFALAIMAAAAFILAYVVATIVETPMRTALAVMAFQVAALAAFISDPLVVPAMAVSGATAAVALHAALRLRASGKK